MSPRTLSLVYAADLAFRLRWEIRTAIDTGGVVIAAPYVDTAVAFGSACGLPESWLRELLRFAPAPDVRGIVCERKTEQGWKARLDRGYGEYGAALFEDGDGRFQVEADPPRHDRGARRRSRPQGVSVVSQGHRTGRQGDHWQPAGRAAPVCFATSQRTTLMRSAGNASIASRAAAWSAFE